MEIGEVFANAKRSMLRQGDVPPTIFIETKDDVYCLSHQRMWDAWNKTTVKKEIALFLTGREFAQKEYVTSESVMSIYLVTEAWTVGRKTEEEIRELKNVSDQPDKKEAIIVNSMLLAERDIKQSIHTAEIIRYGSMVDLVDQHVSMEAESMLLPCFFSGIISAKFDDATLDAKIKRWQETGEFDPD